MKANQVMSRPASQLAVKKQDATSEVDIASRQRIWALVNFPRRDIPHFGDNVILAVFTFSSKRQSLKLCVVPEALTVT